MTLNDWNAEVDRQREDDMLLTRGAWHGYLRGPGYAPMRGEYMLVRWAKPTIAISHDDPDALFRLARTIELALTTRPPLPDRPATEWLAPRNQEDRPVAAKNASGQSASPGIDITVP